MFGRKRKLDDFASEIEAHLQLEIERLQEQGLSAEEARAAARRSFGNVTRARERFYESSRWLGWDQFWQDVRYGVRMLRKAPGFTAIAVLTIALGIGATTAIFSIVDATLLHPLPFPHPEQLVSIEDDLPGVGARDVGISVPEWHDLERSGIFEYVSIMGGAGSVNLTGASQPTRALFLGEAPNYFALLGVKPQLGRTFNPEDHTPGFTLETLISDGLWKRAFGSDPHILGKSVRLDNDLYRVVGVMPAGFHDPGRTVEERSIEVWLGTNFDAAPAPPPLRKSRFIPEAIARIKSGLTIAQAQSRVDALVASLQKEFPEDYPVQSAWKVRLVPLKESVVGNVRQSLILLLAAVGLVLLIGCVNVANLLLARASTRGREMAVRQALGAGRKRLMSQLLTEGLLISVVGGIAGLAILFCTKGFLLQIVPDSLPRLNEVSINWSVLLFALGASLVAGAIFGLAPALHAGRVDLTHMLKQEGRGSTGSGEQARTRRVLVVTEFALSLVLMIAAGLLLRSFWDLLNVRPGFNPQNVMAVRTWLPVPNDPKTDIYGTVTQEVSLLREILRRGRTLPGVQEVAISDLAAVPLGHGRNDLNPYRMVLEGHETSSSQAPLVGASIVTPEYFHLVGMTLLRGRVFGEFDDEKAPPVAVINEAFARTYWPNEDPLGKHIKLDIVRGNSVNLPWTTVIGVLADARTESLAESSVPQIYLSMYQRRAKDLAIFMRGRLDTAAIPVQLREQVQSVDPELPIFGAQTLDEIVSASLSERRFSMEMVSLFALTALLLAGLGIYGVISFIVCERAHEIGIRLALGAQSGNILQMVLRQGLRLAVAGAAVGLVGALVVSHLLAGLLYDVRPVDPLTFLGVALLFIGVALLACYVPARRATKVDPMITLREA
ncbi:MAG TPA: ABC transporter permease [Candidatus Limnocylindria bacterium]|nr:ABC transporter permease [Candidatus Limnocylindria bacterium]